jgi:xylulokinase
VTSLYLGFDVGTQGCKALVIDAATKRILARASASYDVISGLPRGHLEQHPQTWLDAVAAVSAEIRSQVDPSSIRGIGVSGQQHGAVVLDEDGQAIRPAKLWCDTTTATEARQLTEQLGRPVPTGFTASKLLWLARHEPEHWARVRHVLLPHDYVNFALTGERVMEWGDASGTAFFDVETRTFDATACQAIDPRLESMLPELRPAGTLAGKLDSRGSSLIGLPVGIPVALGGGDNMMSAIGSGATRSGVGVLSLGTSATIFARSDTPVIDPKGQIAGFCSSDGAWLPLLCVMNATGPLAEIAALTGMDHDELSAAASEVPIGCDGATFVPFLVGERVPDLPHATGTLHGIRPGTLRPGVLYRAALEGVSCNLAMGLQRMRELGLRPSELRLVGGAARNHLWQRILADSLEVPIRPLLETESAALGAAIQAQWTVERQEDPRCELDALASSYVQLGQAVAPFAGHVDAHEALLARFARQIQALHRH